MNQFISKETQELPTQLAWTFANEPEFTTWTIKARNYNTTVANYMFAFMLCIAFGASAFLYSAYSEIQQPWRVIFCLSFFVLISLSISSMTHQRINFAYRLTTSGIEYCEWKNIPSWINNSLKWLAGLTAIIFIYLATINVAFLIGAIAGPGSLVLIYFSLLNSKKYQQLQTEYHHHFLNWKEIKKVTIATNRKLIELHYSIKKQNSNHLTIGSLYIFFTNQKKELITTTIKKNLPEASFETEKVEVYN